MNENPEHNKEFDQDKVNEIEVNEPEVIDLDETLPLSDIVNGQFGSLKNTPYFKIFNVEGELANLITKNDPYFNPFPNRKARRRMKRNVSKFPKNNKVGVRMIVKQISNNDFLRYRVVKQYIPTNVVPVYDPKMPEGAENTQDYIIGYRKVKEKTIEHYVLATKIND